jgi:hypothetical protein
LTNNYTYIVNFTTFCTNKSALKGSFIKWRFIISNLFIMKYSVDQIGNFQLKVMIIGILIFLNTMQFFLNLFYKNIVPKSITCQNNMTILNLLVFKLIIWASEDIWNSQSNLWNNIWNSVFLSLKNIFLSWIHWKSSKNL